MMESVLITGGSGFLGHALVERLFAEGCDRICIYSRGEHAQARMRAHFNDDDGRLRWFIGDVRDRDRLTRAMNGVDIVIHAAALKRVEVLEYNVLEAVSTNVIGTENVLKAAIDAGVQSAVLVSSDKAVEPLNAYGITKALAEKIFLSAKHYAGGARTRFSVCRYGNIWNSTGSLFPTWRRLLADGAKKVPTTDPECTRFFMLLDEAVDLVIRAAMCGDDDVAIPELPAYRIGDLAEAMGVDMDIIGLRPGEKLHESMRLGETSEHARRMSVDELREVLRRT